MTERCYRCGHVKCVTCGGGGVVWSIAMIFKPCHRCDGGWREAEECALEPCPLREDGKIKDFTMVCCDHGAEGVCRCHGGIRLGADPAVLCPECEKKDD